MTVTKEFQGDYLVIKTEFGVIRLTALPIKQQMKKAIGKFAPNATLREFQRYERCIWKPEADPKTHQELLEIVAPEALDMALIHLKGETYGHVANTVFTTMKNLRPLSAPTTADVEIVVCHLLEQLISSEVIEKCTAFMMKTSSFNVTFELTSVSSKEGF